MSSELETTDALALPGDQGRQLRVSRPVGPNFRKLVVAIRTGDDAMVESAVVSLSQRSRWLAPLAMLVGAFLMLFQGVKLLFTNWRLSLVQILPAMWIWAAMLDLKAHVLHGQKFHVLRGPLLIPIVLAIAAITATAFFLNAVFAFAISRPGPPEIRPAFGLARRHKWTVLGWGFGIGLALGFSTMVVQRWGLRWFGLSLGIVVGILMFTYVLVPLAAGGRQGNPPLASRQAHRLLPSAARLVRPFARPPISSDELRFSCSVRTPSGSWRYSSYWSPSCSRPEQQAP